jgi:hypothetical protein
MFRQLSKSEEATLKMFTPSSDAPHFVVSSKAFKAKDPNVRTNLPVSVARRLQHLFLRRILEPQAEAV